MVETHNLWIFGDSNCLPYSLARKDTGWDTIIANKLQANCIQTANRKNHTKCTSSVQLARHQEESYNCTLLVFSQNYAGPIMQHPSLTTNYQLPDTHSVLLETNPLT